MKEIILIMLASFHTVNAEEPFLQSKFCFIKKEIPENLSMIFENDRLKVISKDESTFSFLLEQKEKLSFPKSLKPNQLPIAIMFQGQTYQISKKGFTKKDIAENPITIGVLDAIGSSLHFSGSWSNLINNSQLTSKEIYQYLEVPFNYYLGDQYITNSLRLHFSSGKSFNLKGLKISKIESQIGLPLGFKVAYDHENLIPNERMNIISGLKFEYNGNVPITFVKDFEEPTLESTLILNNLYPFFITKNQKCFSLAYKNVLILAPETHKQDYEEYYKREESIINRWNIPESAKHNYREEMRSKKLMELYPLGHVFSGNGRAEIKCELTWNEIQYNYFKDPIMFSNEGSKKLITLPEDDTTKIDILMNNTKLKLNLLKRYYVNKSMASSETKIKFPHYKWKEKELICGLPGKDYSAWNEKSSEP